MNSDAAARSLCAQGAKPHSAGAASSSFCAHSAVLSIEETIMTRRDLVLRFSLAAAVMLAPTFAVANVGYDPRYVPKTKNKDGKPVYKDGSEYTPPGMSACPQRERTAQGWVIRNTCGPRT